MNTKPNNQNFFSVEAVGPGHPDKLCDQIADAILDHCLSQDPFAKVACEVLGTSGFLVVSGEITTTADNSWHKIPEKYLKKFGYCLNDYKILFKVNEQSILLNKSVGSYGENLAAGDQGIVVGYACNQTSAFLPWTYIFAQELLKNVVKAKDSGQIPWLGYDMKTLIVVSENNPKYIEKIIFSIQHEPHIDQQTLKITITDQIINPLLQQHNQTHKPSLLINSSGNFSIGGFSADTGLTNRKLMIDSYGVSVPHGGGGYCGKDPTKVDRSGAYFARWVAKNLVAAGIVSSIEVYLVFALGQISYEKIQLTIPSDSAVSTLEIINCIKTLFPSNLNKIIKRLKLNQPIYEKLSSFGHYSPGLSQPWESIDMVHQIKTFFNK